MSVVTAYPKAYIDACRGYVDHQISTFSALAARIDAFADSVPSFVSLLHGLETSFFNDLVIVLDAQFAHRTRRLEGQDANVLNEVRLLASSLMADAGIFTRDGSMKVDPDTSISGIAFGDVIALDRTTFPLICDAFFAQIVARYQETDR